jgi:hypothetical protein
VQAIIATTTVVVGETAARRGEIDAGVANRLTPALENAQLAWSRGELSAEWFRQQEGRDPKGDLELASALAWWSRPAPTATGGMT